MMLTVSYGINNHFLINNGSFNGPVLDGTCHHVAATRSGNTIEYFVDGNSIGTVGFFGSVTTAATDPSFYRIGNCKADPWPFKGNISEVRIWNIARTEAEIQSDMGLSLDGDTPGLVSYWGLHEGPSGILTDAVSEEIGFLGNSETEDVNDPVWSNTCCELTPLGLDHMEQEFISSYPNPVNDMVYLELGMNQAIQLSIIDIAGRIVQAESYLENGTLGINVSSLNSGTYTIQIQSDEGRVLSRFVKE